MSTIVLSPNASGTGSLTIAAPNTNTNQTLTLPDNTGTILTTATGGIPINGPAFSAYQSASQSVTSSVYTKVQFNTEDFDTNNNFDSTTNYRFTPTVAGYYLISAIVRFNGTSPSAYSVALYKNGALYQDLFDVGANLGNTLMNGNIMIYLNGSTDYIEIYGYLVATSPSFGTSGAVASSRIFGGLVRAA